MCVCVCVCMCVCVCVYVRMYMCITYVRMHVCVCICGCFIWYVVFLYTSLAIGPYCFMNTPMSKPIPNRIKQWYKAYLSWKPKKKLSIKEDKSVYGTKNIFTRQDSLLQGHAAAPMYTLIPTSEATYRPHPQGRCRYPSTTAATSHIWTGSSKKWLWNTQESQPWLSFHFVMFLPCLRLQNTYKIQTRR